MLHNPLLYMSLLGFIAKLYATVVLKRNINQPGAKLCAALLPLAYAQSCIEIYGFYCVSIDSYNSFTVLKIYYLLLITSLIIFPILFTYVTNGSVKKYWLLILATVFVFMSMMLIFNFLIIGSTNTAYSITRIKGPYYWVFQVFVLTTLISTLLNLFYIYKTTDQEPVRVKTGNIIISFLPIVVSVSLLLAVMELNYKLTAGGFAPVLFGLLIMIVAHSLKPNTIIDLRVFIPGTKKFKMAYKAVKPFAYCTTSTEYQDHQEQYSLYLVEVADDQFKLNTEKARWLGISEPTYYKRKAQLNQLKTNFAKK